MGEPSNHPRTRRAAVVAVVLALCAIPLTQSAGAMTRGPAASLSSCGAEAAAVFGTVGEGLGTVTPEKTCVDRLPADVTLTATPARGYMLERWSGDCTSTEGNTCTVHATKPIDYTATATFAKRVSNQPPTASIVDIGPNPAHVGELIGFSGDGTDPEGGALGFAWSFGDGGQASGQKAEHAYSAPGDYAVTLTATDPQGATGSAAASVSVVNQPPTAAISSATPNPASIGQTVSFSGGGKDPDGFPVTYAWDFGDGSQAGGQTATHAYASAGSFSVTLTVSDPHGGSARASVSVSVNGAGNQAPTASISSAAPNPAQVGQVVGFKGTGSDPEGGALTFTWDFGDGAHANGASAEHAFGAAGTYQVELTVADPQGASAKATTSVVVRGDGNQAPTASIASVTPNPAVVGQAVTFTGQGSDPEGGEVTYAWDFGDGGRASTAAATHTYAEPGTYAVTLTVADAQGATATARADVRVDANGGETEIVVGDVGAPPEPDRLPPASASLGLETSGGGSIVTAAPSALRAPQASGAARLACGVRGFRCFAELALGRSVRLRAVAARGYAFARWTGACSGTSPTCVVVLRKDATVGAAFAARRSGTVQVSVRRPRIQVRWLQSVGRGELVIRGWVSRKAVVRAQLRRPGGGPLAARVASVHAGRFVLRRKLGPGRLTRGAVVLPGGFVVSLTGRSGGAALPLQVRTLEVPAPPEGVTRRAFASASETGRPATVVPGTAREAWARFVFAVQPRAGAELAVSWFAPNGKLIGTVAKGNRPTVESFIRCDCALSPGDYRAELRARGRTVKRLLVRIR